MASTSVDAVPSTSDVNNDDKTQKADYDKLPSEMHGMKIQDNKADKGDDKVTLKANRPQWIGQRFFAFLDNGMPVLS